MSSLDEELKNLQKPIQNSIDLNWLTSGQSFNQSDTVHPNAQAGDWMNQLLFNREVVKANTYKLLPQERAIGQFVVACLQEGYDDNKLSEALCNTFGRESLSAYVDFIQGVKNIVASGMSLPKEIIPTSGIKLCVGSSTKTSSANYAAKMSSAALAVYKSANKSTMNETINLEEPEMEIQLKKVYKDDTISLSEGDLNKIAIAAKSLLSEKNDLELGKIKDSISDDLLNGESISPLEYIQEADLLGKGSNKQDIVFNKPYEAVGKGGFVLNLDNANLGLDEDLSCLAGTPPQSYVDDKNFDFELLPSEVLDVTLDNKKPVEDLQIGLSNDLEIEI